MSDLFIAVWCFYVGAFTALALRTALDLYVDNYKRKRGQWPYDREVTR